MSLFVCGIWCVLTTAIINLYVNKRICDVENEYVRILAYFFLIAMIAGNAFCIVNVVFDLIKGM